MFRPGGGRAGQRAAGPLQRVAAPPAARAAAGGSGGVVCGRGSSVLGRGQRLHRQRMDLGLHSIAQGLVNALMAPHAALAFEFSRNDHGLEMLAVPLDHQVAAGQAIGNVLLDFGGRGQGLGHDGRRGRKEMGRTQLRILYPVRSRCSATSATPSEIGRAHV